MTNESKKPPALLGSQDLLTYFNLIPIYNKVVKPYPPPDRAVGLDPTLFPYISDLPGKMDMEPDDYLLKLLRDPQAVDSGPEIRPLDAATLKDAFSLKEGPVPGFDPSILGTDDIGNSGGGGGIGYISTYVGGGDQYGQAHDTDHGERKHKKKKKKRRHGHEHDGEDGHEHKKKKKKKKAAEMGIVESF
ncbi:hypothetical protein [Parasitella parasitica]|uniref:Mediator of RNA polymerase II transcription subunit 19 n=1 Tax=Parasitella parasitica TaxID=35722 RepID=A0A0B7N1M6_9FUNG|nr:hypothetical protein [Parasitella parasitica]